MTNRFSKSDHFRLSDLLQHTYSIRQCDKFVTAYFNKLKTLWEDFEALRVLPTCICGDNTTIKKQYDMEYVV